MAASSRGGGGGYTAVAQAVMAVALRCLGVDEVLVLGERDVATTLTAALLGNMLPLLPLPQPHNQHHREPATAGGSSSSSSSSSTGSDWVRSDVDEVALARDIRAALQARTYQGAAPAAAPSAVASPSSADSSQPSPSPSPSQSPSPPPPPPPPLPCRSPAARRAVVVFPERGVGGREGSLRPWRLSVAALAAALGCPVVPAFISGTQRCLPSPWSIPRRRRVAVEVGLPLPPGKATDAALLEALALLRVTVRARRAGGWRARPRNRRPAPQSGLLGAAENAAWLAAGWLSVAAAAALMAALWVVDGIKVAVMAVARALVMMLRGAAA